MTKKTIKPRTDTAEQILDIAERLIQTRGYNAFSYQDIADALNIRKASIHYHFSSKTELGASVVKRYSVRFAEAFKTIYADKDMSATKMLDFYSTPYLQFSNTKDKVCLCGALASEILALPEEIQKLVKDFFDAHQNWIVLILEHGVKRDEFLLDAKIDETAHMIFSAMQGALLVERATGNSFQMQNTIATIKAQLIS